MSYSLYMPFGIEMENHMKKVIIATLVGLLSLSTPAFAETPTVTTKVKPTKEDRKAAMEKYKADKKAYDAKVKAISEKYKAELKALADQKKAAGAITDLNVKAQTLADIKAKVVKVSTARTAEIKALGKAPKAPKGMNKKNKNNKKNR